MLIYLCSPATAPFLCRFYTTTPAGVIAHLTHSHAGFLAYQQQHGHSALASIPLAADLLSPTTTDGGLPIWVCPPCSEYHTSNAAAVSHLLEPLPGHADTADILYRLGDAGLFEHVRREHGRVLVMHSAAAVAPRWLAVNFVKPYQVGHVVVEVPGNTCTRVMVEALVPEDPNGVRVDWRVLWRDGLVVRCLRRDGRTSGPVVRTDEDVKALVEGMEMAECWIGDAVRA